MARRLRIQYPGARYHVINRGNLQHGIFATDGARHSFLGAGVVAVEPLDQFRSSSFWHALHRSRMAWLRSAELLRFLGLEHDASPWAAYLTRLVAVAGCREDDRNVPGTSSIGWAIGTAAWRQQVARQNAHLALAPEISSDEVAEIRSTRWLEALREALHRAGKTQDDVACAPKGIDRKITIARERRATVAAPYRWISTRLNIGHPSAVHGDVARRGLRSAD